MRVNKIIVNKNKTILFITLYVLDEKNKLS